MIFNINSDNQISDFKSVINGKECVGLKMGL